MAFTCLCTISILILVVSLSSAENSNRNRLTNLKDVELTSTQAVELCQVLNGSRIQDHQLYFWTSVHTDDEPQKNRETFSPECYTLQYKSCAGQPRYPLKDTCGYFAPIQDKNCLSNQRSKRSPAKQITLTHGTASHLCAGVNHLPTDSSFQLNFVPINVLLNPKETRGVLSGKCIHWVHTACDSDDAKSGLTECQGWKMQIDQDESCVRFFDFFEKFNVTHSSRYANPSLQTSDFVEGAVADEAAPAWTTSFLSSIIKCANKNSNIVCEVLPENKDRRSKRAPTPQTPISRVKRQCCSFADCSPCGYSRYNRYFGRQGPRCNCGNQIDDYCETEMVGCSNRLDSAGACYLCCEADCIPGIGK